MYKEAIDKMYSKLGHKKIIALATSLNDHVMVRNVSGIIHEQRIFFKTDREFRKTQQLLENPQVAICWWGIQIEGTAVNHGLVVDEPGQVFQQLYQKHWDKSYNAYAHEDSEILIEIVPTFAEVWDQDKEDNGFQTFIDFEKQQVEVKYYD